MTLSRTSTSVFIATRIWIIFLFNTSTLTFESMPHQPFYFIFYVNFTCLFKTCTSTPLPWIFYSILTQTLTFHSTHQSYIFIQYFTSILTFYSILNTSLTFYSIHHSYLAFVLNTSRNPYFSSILHINLTFFTICYINRTFLFNKSTVQ